jgi:N-acetylmuramoyl-L-alanine amidase
MPFRVVLAWTLLLFTVPAKAAEVDGFRVWAGPDKTRAVLDLDSRADYKLFTLDNPPRVVIDLKKSGLETRLQLDQEHDSLIDGVRHGTPSKDTLRVVLDLEGRA